MSKTTTNHIDWFMQRYRGLSDDDMSESTFQQRRSELEDFRDWYGDDLTEATGDDIEEYIIHLSLEGYASGTIASRRWALNKFYRQMEDKGRLAENPMENVAWEDVDVVNGPTQKEVASKENERIHPLTPDEVQQLADHVPEPKVRNELLIRLMAQTGMRAHEVAGLTLDRIDPENTGGRKIKIIDNKTGDSREVVYQPSLDFLMSEWRDRGRREVYTSVEDSDYLFVTRQSPKMGATRVNKVVINAAERAGIQEILYTDVSGNKRRKVTAHCLRHTFAVEALKNGMNLRYLQEVLGHDELRTTEMYLNYVSEDAVDDMRNNGPSFTE